MSPTLAMRPPLSTLQSPEYDIIRSKRERTVSPDTILDEEGYLLLNTIDPGPSHKRRLAERDHSIFPHEIPIKPELVFDQSGNPGPNSTGSECVDETRSSKSPRPLAEAHARVHAPLSMADISDQDRSAPRAHAGHISYAYQACNFKVLSYTEVKTYDVWKNLKMLKEKTIERPFPPTRSGQNKRRKDVLLLEALNNDLLVWGKVTESDECQTCTDRAQVCIVRLRKTDESYYEVGSRCLCCQTQATACSLVLYQNPRNSLRRVRRAAGTPDSSRPVDPDPTPIQSSISTPEKSVQAEPCRAHSNGAEAPNAPSPLALIDLPIYLEFLKQRVLQLGEPDLGTRALLDYQEALLKTLTSFARYDPILLSRPKFDEAEEAAKDLINSTHVLSSRVDVATGCLDVETKSMVLATVEELKKIKATVQSMRDIQ